MSTYLAMVGDAVANLGNRPWRSAMSAFGIVIGTASAIGLAGLTATNEARIAALLLEDRSPHLVLRDDPAAAGARPRPLDRTSIDGVRTTRDVEAASAATTHPSQQVSALPPGITSPHLLTVVVADHELAAAAGLTMRSGRPFDAGHVGRGDRVALLGEGAARRVGVDVDQPFVAVFLEGEPYLVTGVFDRAHVDPALLYSVVIPPTPSFAAASPGIDTIYALTDSDDRLATASLVALRAAPLDPQRFDLTVDTPSAIASSVSTELASFTGLIVTVGSLIGMLVVATVLTTSVGERSSEIGVRRALGASRLEIGVMFVAEGLLLGVIGAGFGVAIGLGGLTALTWLRDWPLVIPVGLPATVLVQGMVIGGAASVIAASRAARLDPQLALTKL